MGETFYTILDVAPDADRETIRRAYRDRVKDVHPDVSDNPDATETFKQLTTTRDVLLNRDERQRYDRLGHDAYVREHVSSPVWSPSETGHGAEGSSDATRAATASGSGRERAGETRRRHHRTRGHHEANASTDWGTSADYRGQSSRGYSTRRRRGTFAQENWQTASEAYRRSETEFDRRRERTLYDAVLVVRRLAPWLLVHTLLIGSALATVWFTYSSTNPQTGAAASTFVGAVALVSVMGVLSVFHLLSVCYA